MSDSKECVQVVVRCRPMNEKENREHRSSIVETDGLAQISIRNPNKPDQPPKTFTFDAVYDENSAQRQVYEVSCLSLVESVLEGFNGTIFAYGQTGCGKTHTMQGLHTPPEMRGVIPCSFDHIFEYIKASEGVEYLVRCNYLEIYNEEIRDLLVSGPSDSRRCEIREDPDKGIVVNGLHEPVVQDKDACNRIMEMGQRNRTTGETDMNAKSSRSHSIFTITVEMSKKDEETGEDHIRVGKLNLVDLAGSERQSKTGAKGARLTEGCKINLSLSALGNVISALVDGKGKHIPYRDSKLTRLLQDSLGGNTKTLMVAAISPADYNYEETLSTLRYANRAKNIKNKPRINEDPKDTLLRQYKEEIERLKAQLAEAASGAVPATAPPAAAPAAAVQQPEAPMAPEAQAHPTPAPATTAPASSTVPAAAPQSDPALEPDHPQAPELSLNAATQPHPEPQQEQQQQPQSSQDQAPQQQRETVVVVQQAEPQLVVQEKIVVQEKVVVQKEIVEVEVERVPKKHAEQKEELETLNRKVLDQRNELGEQLQAAHRDRDTLAQQLRKLESKLIGAVDDSQDISPEVAEQRIQAREEERVKMQKKLRAQRKRQETFQQERQKVIGERAQIEEELKSAMESAEENEKRMQRLKRRHERKMAEARAEIEDLQEEFEREREQLLDTIREQNRELKLWEQVVSLILPTREIGKIWERSVWKEDGEEWELPRLKPKAEFASLKLPTLGGGEQPECADGNLGPESDVSSQAKPGGSSRGGHRKKRGGNARPPRPQDGQHQHAAADSEGGGGGMYESEEKDQRERDDRSTLGDDAQFKAPAIAYGSGSNSAGSSARSSPRGATSFPPAGRGTGSLPPTGSEHGGMRSRDVSPRSQPDSGFPSAFAGGGMTSAEVAPDKKPRREKSRQRARRHNNGHHGQKENNENSSNSGSGGSNNKHGAGAAQDADMMQPNRPNSSSRRSREKSARTRRGQGGAGNSKSRDTSTNVTPRSTASSETELTAPANAGAGFLLQPFDVVAEQETSLAGAGPQAALQSGRAAEPTNADNQDMVAGATLGEWGFHDMPDHGGSMAQDSACLPASVELNEAACAQQQNGYGDRLSSRQGGNRRARRVGSDDPGADDRSLNSKVSSTGRGGSIATDCDIVDGGGSTSGNHSPRADISPRVDSYPAADASAAHWPGKEDPAPDGKKAKRSKSRDGTRRKHRKHQQQQQQQQQQSDAVSMPPIM